MKSSQARYLIGIDLGTTHTVVCYTDLTQPDNEASLQLFEIEQLVGPGEVAKRPLLPSFRYHPADGELPESQMVLPWSQRLSGDTVSAVVGEFARELGSKVEGRLISSAKSWLSHDKVDRSADILPWAGADDVQKISPVFASASYLHHVRCAWNYEHPNHPMETQELVITVPASFDEAARALTLQAAEMAGLRAITLLEEPQAVCYDWYRRQGTAVSDALNNTRLLFVVDVGGGTTDLSLIQIDHSNDQLSLQRIAVGDHWMLGGDNIDLALAHQAEQQITKGAKSLNAASLSQLIQQSRNAKERLLSSNAPNSAKVTLLGGGARLIGGARSAEFSQEDVKQLALEGFFPMVAFGDLPVKRNAAIVEFGLPFAPDPAVSRYLSQFLSHHQPGCRKALGLPDDAMAIPDAVLFNGGCFKSDQVRERALNLLSQWKGESVQSLNNPHPDLAVAYGAVAFGLARRNRKMRIGGGSARSYFLRVQSDDGKNTGVCLLPKGSEEGQDIPLVDRRFALTVNQPVQFMLSAYSGDEVFTPGQIIDLDSRSDRERFMALPPLIAALDNAHADKRVDITLVTRLTEVGTIDLHCQALHSNQRWQVEFQLRKALQQHRGVEGKGLPANFSKALEAIDQVYGPSDKNADPGIVKRLRQSLEKLLGDRADWDTELSRALYDALWERRKRRRRTQAHERVWFNLAGFCLRPGFGFPADDWRTDNAWSLYQQSLQFDKESQSWAEWWTFWRRAAGGLDETAQKCLFKDLSKFLNPASARNLKIQNEIKNKAYEDMVRLSASLESIPVSMKEELGQWFVKRLQKSSETQTSWWALGRIAAREPFHGGAQSVIASQKVEPWVELILKQDWKKNQNAAFAAVLIGRVCGDRSRDLSESVRLKIHRQLIEVKSPESWQQWVLEHVKLDDSESKRVFGEALPVGLMLI